VAERVLAVLRDEGLDPARLVLEVTEGVLIDEEVGLRLQVLRDAGVRIALDDFGTGWSSLTYLRRFPVDVLKLDRSFVRGIAGGSGAEAVPGAVLQMAAALGLEVIAEGIETPEQLQVLRRLGCRIAQGYMLGAPGPACDHVDLVRRGRIVGGPSVLAAHARPR
jgi:EAL domain-containing protein (putative c-di-GMP-specific phosphodiesterase class I)